MDAKVWGVGTSKAVNGEVILGRNYNQVRVEKELIRINHGKYSWKKTGEKSIKAYPVGYEDVKFKVEVQSADEKHIDFTFEVDSPEFSTKEPTPGHIEITNPENAPKIDFGNGIWPAIIGAIATIVSALIKKDNKKKKTCTEQAIKACGEGNVASVDSGGWFRGCSFKCK